MPGIPRRFYWRAPRQAHSCTTPVFFVIPFLLFNSRGGGLPAAILGPAYCLAVFSLFLPAVQSRNRPKIRELPDRIRMSNIFCCYFAESAI